MEYKKVNWSFFIFFGLDILLIIFLSFNSGFFDLNNELVSSLVSEAPIVIPSAVFLLTNRYDEGICNRIALKKIKPLTIVSVIVYGILIIPIGILANSVSMLWVDNTVLEQSGTMLDNPWYITFISSAVVAPLAEEFTFRGFMYRGYRRDGLRLSAAIVSAIAFAFMHMNFNQAAYALIIGMAFAFIVEATGSIWSSIICHAMFNAESVILMYVVNFFEPDAFSDTSVDRGELLSGIPHELVVAAVAAVLAALVLLWAAKLQGRTEEFKSLFKKNKEYEGRRSILSIPLIVAFILCFGVMLLLAAAAA